ncbi:unnamed protein product [Linum trigynum]|uniref:Uncharacterized protein n=1 Tax=Linum trigynum TaxID=586398 RepID=A0AAV2CQJ5_9ROSI
MGWRNYGVILCQEGLAIASSEEQCCALEVTGLGQCCYSSPRFHPLVDHPGQTENAGSSYLLGEASIGLMLAVPWWIGHSASSVYGVCFCEVYACADFEVCCTAIVS